MPTNRWGLLFNRLGLVGRLWWWARGVERHVAELVGEREALPVARDAAVGGWPTDSDHRDSVDEERHAEVLAKFVVHRQHEASKSLGGSGGIRNSLSGGARQRPLARKDG